MATNTLRPTDSPRRANVPRAAPAPAPELLPETPSAVVPEPKVVPAPALTPDERARKPAPEAAPRTTWSLFSLLDRVTSVDGLFREGLPVRFLPHLLFVMALTLLYIGNTHYGNRMNRSIQRLKQETEDLRADYTTLKSDYMEASKQSEVARKVAAFGLVESSSPPFRIAVPAGHLDAAELELMPVLTADTLAARADRDSAAALRSDQLAGRRRVPLSADAADAGPEIIAPPHALGGDSAGEAGSTAPVRRVAPASIRRKPGPPKPTANKVNIRSKAQGSTSEYKDKRSVKQVVSKNFR